MSSDWKTTKLKDVGTWLSGGTPRTSVEEYWNGDIPWISSKSLTEFRVRDAERRVSQLGASNGTRMVPADTILMVVRGMSLKTEFRMGITQRQVAFGQDCKAILPATGIDPTFLAYAIRAKSDEILELVDEAGHGTGRLQMDLLNNVEIELPPLEDQQAIAAALGLLDDKLELNAQARQQALLLAQGMLSAGDQLVRVGDVAGLAKGLSYKGAGLVETEEDGAVPMINLASFTRRGWFKATGLKFYNGEYKPKHVLYSGDLVIANTDLTQDRAILGRGGLVPPDLDGAISTHHTSVVKFQGEDSLRLFLWAQLQTPAFRERAEGYATGTTVTALPAEVVLDFAITCPSDSDERHAVISRASRLIERVWALEAESNAIRDLRDALMPELLTGGVRVPLEAIA